MLFETVPAFLFAIPIFTYAKFLLDDVLRKEWGFNGFVVTDYTGINEMVPHGYAENLKHAGELAMNAGVDMDMQGGVYKNHMKQSIDEGKISTERLDEAVKGILRISSMHTISWRA